MSSTLTAETQAALSAPSGLGRARPRPSAAALPWARSIVLSARPSRRFSSNTIATIRSHASAAQPGVVVLHNGCVAPGAKVLAKDGWLVKVIPLADPTEDFDFDTIIVSLDDYVAMMDVLRLN
jgi:hypothetical protein